MSFGLYVHIPYCLQRCTYCDFATVGSDHHLSPQQYFELISQELRLRRALLPESVLSSVYFGGGTPSLVGPDFIDRYLKLIQNLGVRFSSEIEITIEINPGTMNSDSFKHYLRAGVNRFSIGAQTFNQELLRQTGRRHSVKDTRDLLHLVREHLFTADILFALPGQTLAHVRQDIEEILSYHPAHLSTYCLTVPEKHPMAKGRAPDDEQVAMFDLIESLLNEADIYRYEISNFAKKGFESRHNRLYWNDQPYLGIGMSAHSYLPSKAWGVRFWNASSMEEYARQVRSAGQTWHWRDLPPAQVEQLALHQSLTDFVHTALRQMQGLEMARLRAKFALIVCQSLQQELDDLNKSGLLTKKDETYALSKQGVTISDFVFSKITYLEGDLPPF